MIQKQAKNKGIVLISKITSLDRKPSSMKHSRDIIFATLISSKQHPYDHLGKEQHPELARTFKQHNQFSFFFFLTTKLKIKTDL